MSITVTFCLRSLGIPVFVHPKIHNAKRQNMYDYFSWKQMTFKRYSIKGPSLKHATSHGAPPPSAVMADSHMVQSERWEENC